MSEFKNGNYSKAFQTFSKLDNLEPTPKEIYSASYYYSALCLIEINQIEGALVKLEDFVSSFKSSNYRKDALYKLGTIYYLRKEYERSRRSLFTLSRDYPDDDLVGAAYYWIGESFITEGKLGEAEEFLKESISLREKNKYLDYSIYTLGNLYEKVGKYSEAVAYYDELLTYYRSSDLAKLAQLRIGISYFKLEEYDAAILELTSPLIEELPFEQQTEAQYVLANSLFKQNQFAEAEAKFEQLLNESSEKEKKDKIQYGLAWVRFQTGQFESAYELFDLLSITAVDKVAESGLFWSGECKRYLGNLSAARRIYTKFLTDYPMSDLVPQVRLNLGLIDFNEGNVESAKSHLEYATKSQDNFAKAKALTVLGEINLRGNNYNQARDSFNEAVQLKDISAELTNRAKLGFYISQYYLKNYGDVIENLSKLLRNNNRFEKEKVSFYLAESYYQLGNFLDASKFYSNIDPNNGEIGEQALYGKAYSHFNMKDYPNSSYFFGEYVKKFKNSENYIDASLRLADSFYGIKNFEKSAEIFDELFRKNKSKIQSDFSYFQYAQTLFNIGRNEEAIRIAKELQRTFYKSKYSDDAQYLIGWIYFQNYQYQKAIENYQELLDRYPSSPFQPVMYSSIGDAYYNLGEYDVSVDYYSLIIDRFPRTKFIFDAITGIQYCYVAKNEPEKAADFIDRYVVNNPKNEFAEEVYFKKGEIYYSVGNYEMAKVSYKEFIATFPNSNLVADAYYWIGKCAMLSGNNQEAEYNLSILIEKYPYTEMGVTGALELSEILAERGENEEALNIINNILESAPETKSLPEVIYTKGRYHIKLNQLDDAYKALNEVATYHPESVFGAKAKIELGLLELAKKSYRNAEILFSELGTERLDDIGAQAQFYYGESLFDQDRIEEAVSAFVRVRTVFSNYDEWFTRSLLRLGDCYIKMKEWQKARDMFRSVLQRHKNDDFGYEARKKLSTL
ncbi:MAG: tetratricopeptide repeat protein [Melioribacteraceae bacterium]|nr:tetratricopeptide repeat protein [Melioribacteraceae bacterium]MCF8265016.1 tetratricopeptide repeat protein [Melioribacteraceae bacterium]MCF8431587.1 tetratricopeptide repeat protein [Melioribacteraceae bacterium]